MKTKKMNFKIAALAAVGVLCGFGCEVQNHHPNADAGVSSTDASVGNDSGTTSSDAADAGSKDACTPKCKAVGIKACGDDGCGGSCGTCGTGNVCQAGVCVEPSPDADASVGNDSSADVEMPAPGSAHKCPGDLPSDPACKPTAKLCDQGNTWQYSFTGLCVVKNGKEVCELANGDGSPKLVTCDGTCSGAWDKYTCTPKASEGSDAGSTQTDAGSTDTSAKPDAGSTDTASVDTTPAPKTCKDTGCKEGENCNLATGKCEQTQAASTTTDYPADWYIQADDLVEVQVRLFATNTFGVKDIGYQDIKQAVAGNVFKFNVGAGVGAVCINTTHQPAGGKKFWVPGQVNGQTVEKATQSIWAAGVDYWTYGSLTMGPKTAECKNDVVTEAGCWIGKVYNAAGTETDNWNCFVPSGWSGWCGY